MFAGLPYDCLRAGNVTATDCVGAKTPDIEPLAANIRAWSGSAIDDVANLARQRVYLFVGQHDGTYSATVVGQTASLLRRFVDAANLRLETTVDAGHLFPADFDNPYSAGGWRCSSLTVPVANCGFDGAGAMLQWIYGPLSPREQRAAGDRLLPDRSGRVRVTPRGHGRHRRSCTCRELRGGHGLQAPRLPALVRPELLPAATR